MSSINIENIKLTSFDKNNKDHIYLYNELTLGESKSDMIHQIKERLDTSRDVESLEFSNAYIISVLDDVVGYLYLTGKNNGKVYIEMSLLKEFRKKHLGTYLLDIISNYICMDNTDLKEIRANIDRSNLGSMKMVENAGFFYDDDVDYQSQKIDFIKENPYYIRKGR